MRVVAVVQARVGSTRLPGKVLLPVAGASLLQRMLERVRGALSLDEVVLATTREAADDPILDVAAAIGVRVFRGHPTDLLDRHYQVGVATRAHAVVKIPSDCPLIDPDVIDEVVNAWRAEAERWDYMSNLHPPTWPDGNDVEVISMPVLEQAWREAKAPHEREHTTPFTWDQPRRYRLGNVVRSDGLDYSASHRFTLDYPEDYQFIKAVYTALWRPERPLFRLPDILAWLERYPETLLLNARYCGETWYTRQPYPFRTGVSA